MTARQRSTQAKRGPSKAAADASQRVSTALREAIIHAGFQSNARDMYIATGHVQAYATLHAADLLAKAIDRNTAALKALSKLKSV